MATPEGVLILGKTAAIVKSLRLEKVVPRAFSESATPALAIVTQTPDTLVPEHPVLKPIGVVPICPMML